MKKINQFLLKDKNKFTQDNKLKSLLAKGERLVIPFVGTGNAFLNTNYSAYLLADKDPDLINMFKMLAEHKQKFITIAKKYFSPVYNDEKVYLYYKDVFDNMPFKVNACDNWALNRASIFLYLKHRRFKEAYNKIQGANKKTENCSNESYFPEVAINTLLAKFETCDVEFLTSDFATTLALAKHNDVVFCEPPFVSVNKEDYFANNDRVKFSWADLFRLITHCSKLEDRGISVIISSDNINRENMTEMNLPAFGNTQMELTGEE